MTYKEVQKFHEDSKILALFYRAVISANPDKKGLKFALERLTEAV